jgi:hypothetical protein
MLILAIATCCAIVGCAPKASITVSGPNDTSEDTKFVIYELVLRNLVADEPSGRKILVSFGESWVDHVDPPEGFFDRLADVDVSLQPVSKRGELANANAVLFEIRLVEWTGESEAKVSVTRFRLGVGASNGFAARVEWVDGAWRLAKATGHWGT